MMKKIISLVLALCLLVTMMFTATVPVSAESSLFNKYNVATTQITGNYIGAGQGDNYVNSTITINDWSYGLSGIGWSNTWRQTLLFFDKDSKTAINLKANAKYIVNVDYTIVSSNDSWGVQIGLFSGILANGVTNGSSKKLDPYFAHKTADVGKNFTYSAVFTATADQNFGLQFAGSGSVTFNSITVFELPAENIENFAAVTYVDNGKKFTEFVEKNTAPKTLEKFGYKFGGWYENQDLSGEALATVASDVTLYSNWKYLYGSKNIAITQITGNYVGAAANQNYQDSTITAYDYSYGLSGMGWGGTWRQSLIFFDVATQQAITLKTGSKYIVNMEYTIDKANDSWGLQVGLFGGIGANGVTSSSSTRPADYIAYKNADVGKTFTTVSVFTATADQNIGLQFAGQGTLTLKSITVWELPAENVDICSAVTYVEDGKKTGEFVENNTAPKTLESAEKAFAGWYTASDLSGNVVATITEDITVYPKWIETANYDIVRTESTTPDNLVGASSGVSISMSGTKISTSSYNGYKLSSNGWGSWRPTFFFLKETAGTKTKFMTKAGAKYIVELEYVVASNRTDGHALQVGLFGNLKDNGQTENAVWLDTDAEGNKLYKTHTSADNGKTINYTVEFTAASAHNMGLVFYGEGSITLNKIKVHELPAELVNRYATVSYNDEGVVSTEFVLKNTELKASSKENQTFKGWYDSNNTKVTTVTGDIAVTAAWFKEGNVDLTQSVKIDGDKATMDVTVPTDNATPLNVTIQGFKSILIDKNTGEALTSTWSAGAIVALKFDADKYVSLKNTSKYVVNVEYDVTKVSTTDSTYYPQIAIVYNNNNAQSNVLSDNGTKILTVKKHSEKVNNATISCVVSGVNSNALRLAFDGQGTFDIKSVTVTELINNVEMKFVTYKDSNTSTDKIAALNKGDSLVNLAHTLTTNFGGWYNGDEKVTEITEDVSVVAKWFDKYDLTMNDTVDVRDLVCLKNALSNETDDAIYDVNRDNAISSMDTVVLMQKMLGVEVVTIDGNSINDYAVVTGDQMSLMSIKATNSLVDSVDETFGVDLLANDTAKKKITVGVTNVDASVLKSGALENLTGAMGDTYGLDDYKIFLNEGNVYIEGGSDYATAVAVNKFVDFISENKMIPANFEISGKYNGEKDILNGYSLVWSDEFDGDALNAEYWSAAIETKDGPAYSDEQMKSIFGVSNTTLISGKIYGKITVGDKTFTRKDYDLADDKEWNLWCLGQTTDNGEGSLVVSDGLLTMNSTANGTNFTGANITANHNFKYGIMEARIMLGSRDGAAASFWARSKDKAADIPVNEFDFVENFGSEQIVGNLHTWENAGKTHINHNLNAVVVPDEGEKFSDTFHHIAFVWTQDKVTFYLDGVAYLEQDITDGQWDAFREETFLKLGVTVPKGDYIQYYDEDAVTDYADYNVSQKVDYIRIYQTNKNFTLN